MEEEAEEEKCRLLLLPLAAAEWKFVCAVVEQHKGKKSRKAAASAGALAMVGDGS